jgi:hypothetical protein
MAKKTKTHRLKVKAKPRAKATTKGKSTSTKTKSKTKKKVKMETTKFRLSKPLKVTASFSDDKREQPVKQTPVTEATQKPAQPKTNLLPIKQYQLEVDGTLKSDYPTAEAARKAGLDLKKKYPFIRVAVFNSKERTRTAVELSE